MHQLNDLPDDHAQFADHADANARMRREGTRNLLAAAQAADTPRFIAQSIAWQIPGDRGAAVSEHERAVLDAGGVIIRYGQLYGPGNLLRDRAATAAARACRGRRPPHPARSRSRQWSDRRHRRRSLLIPVPQTDRAVTA